MSGYWGEDQQGLLLLCCLKIATIKLILIENINICVCDKERGREGGKNEGSRRRDQDEKTQLKVAQSHLHR